MRYVLYVFVTPASPCMLIAEPGGFFIAAGASAIFHRSITGDDGKVYVASSIPFCSTMRSASADQFPACQRIEKDLI